MSTQEELLPCPFCGGEAQFRKALWPSDGNTDAIIHAAPSECGLSHFDIGTTDESVIAAWNRRTPPAAFETHPLPTINVVAHEAGNVKRSPPAAVPDGWVLVPCEPTPAMVEAGWIDKEDVNPDDIYRAMISAAPAAPTEASNE